MDRLRRISEIVSSLSAIEITSPFVQEGEVIRGTIRASIGDVALLFDVVIAGAYPLQFHGSETILFFNKDLIEYNHVMRDGNICIHTSHSSDLEEKLRFDFDSLREWIMRFYLGKEHETHYEHIVVPSSKTTCYFFTDVDRRFVKNDFGIFSYSMLSESKVQGQQTQSYLVQQFEINSSTVPCRWSSWYRAMSKEKGAFVFVENAPVFSRKFAVENWLQLADTLSQEFLGFLSKLLKQAGKRTVPLLVGYNISKTEIHWEVILLRGNDPPIYGKKIEGSKDYLGTVKDKEIIWGSTKNCSFEYFFGRGALNTTVTNANVLIVGVGAVGSQIATSLVRGGCRKLTLADHDSKDPENVCRSEYWFKTGITTKVLELADSLTSISPFVEVTPVEKLMDAAKFLLENPEYSDRLKNMLDEFDIIVDCSTDDDVSYVLERFKVRGRVFNISITNHANELVCVVSPGIYQWLKSMNHKFHSPAVDLYNPSGCWNPTFRASHNDISVLVQFALRQINQAFERGGPFRNFILSSVTEDEFNIKLKQF